MKDVTMDEQKALIAVARRASQVVIAGRSISRERDDLLYYLDQLAAHHGQAVLGASQLRSIINVIVNASQSTSGGWELDISAVLAKARPVFTGAGHFDVEIHFPGLARAPLRGELENAPAGVQPIDPMAPPAWLT